MNKKVDSTETRLSKFLEVARQVCSIQRCETASRFALAIVLM